MAEYIVIIPTYNEQENIRSVIRQVFEASPELDILIVDDQSPDGTGAIVEELKADEARLHLLTRSKKEGLGRAYVAGFQWALEHGYQGVIQMDADLSHDPLDLARFLEASHQADMAVGSRYVDGIRIINWPLSRLILSKAASLYVRILTGLPLTDPTGGFNWIHRCVLENVDLHTLKSLGYSFQVELKHRAWMRGFCITEVPIIFRERRSGQSKMDYAIVQEAVILVWLLVFRSRFRRRPLTARHPESLRHVSD